MIKINAPYPADRRYGVMNKPLRMSLDAPTAHENFLYLFHELEAAIERGTIRWPAGSVFAAQLRPKTLTAEVRQIAERPREN